MAMEKAGGGWGAAGATQNQHLNVETQNAEPTKIPSKSHPEPNARIRQKPRSHQDPPNTATKQTPTPLKVWDIQYQIPTLLALVWNENNYSRSSL